MNNPFVQEQAAGLADRLIAASSDPSAADRAGLSNWPGVAPPDTDEVERALEFLRMRSSARRGAVPAATREREAWTSLAKVMLTANEFLYID